MKKPNEYAIEIAMAFKDSLTREELAMLASKVNKAIKEALNQERAEQIKTIKDRMAVLLAETSDIEKALGKGFKEEDAPENITTWNGYQTWKKEQTKDLKESLFAKRGEYWALKRLRSDIHQRMFSTPLQVSLDNSSDRV